MLMWMWFWGCGEKFCESHDSRQPGCDLRSKPDVVKESSVSGVTWLRQRLHAAVNYSLRWSLRQIVSLWSVTTQTFVCCFYYLPQFCVCISLLSFSQSVYSVVKVVVCMQHLNVRGTCRQDQTNRQIPLCIYISDDVSCPVVLNLK